VRRAAPLSRLLAAATPLAAAALAAATLAACGAHHHAAARERGRAARPAQAARVSPSAPGLIARRPCPRAPGFTCATLRVPLDHAGRVAGTLALRVAVQDGGAARHGVLLFLSGGPGQPGVPFVRRIRTVLGAQLNGFRLVMFDQRGTGAGALECPALQRAAGYSDLIAPPPGVIEACARAIGPRRRFFATSETVGDIEQLRQALDVRRMTLDGVSYGTFVAERYALRYPARVAALVLDSVVPQQGVDPLYAAALAGAGRVLRSVCASQRCGYDPAADVAALVRTRHDGPALLTALVAESIVQPSFPGVLAALHRAVAGDTTQLRIFLADGANAGGVTAAELSQGLHESALCAELAAPWNPAAPPRSRAGAIVRLVAREPAARLYPFDRATAAGNALVQDCLRWPATPRPAVPTGDVNAPLPHVPVLLLAGTHDLSTPLPWAQQEAREAPDGRLLVVPGAGHSVQLRARDPAVRATLGRFLASVMP